MEENFQATSTVTQHAASQGPWAPGLGRLRLLRLLRRGGLWALGLGRRDSGLGTLTPSHGQHGSTYVCMYSVHEPKMKGPSESCRRPCRARDGQGMEGAVSFSFLLLAGSRGNVDRITRAGFWRSRAAYWSLHRTTWWLGNGTNSRPWPSINALWALQ